MVVVVVVVGLVVGGGGDGGGSSGGGGVGGGDFSIVVKDFMSNRIAIGRGLYIIYVATSCHYLLLF